MKNQQFDFSVNLLSALLWQYNTADSLQALLQSKQDWYDENQEQFWLDWLRDVFDLRTANEFGCAVWAILLDVPLAVILQPDYLDKPTYGYGQYHGNFNRSNYAVTQQTPVVLTLAQSRLVLQLRYFQLIAWGNIPQTNELMKTAFADYGLVYALDPLDMSDVVYVFTFALPSALQFVLTHYDILPRPATLGVKYVIQSQQAFGYGPYHLNYNRGNYGA